MEVEQGIRICMQLKREKLQRCCSWQRNVPPISALFSHFLQFCPSLCWGAAGKPIPTQFIQPAIYPSIRVCIYQCIQQGIHQSIHFHRNVRRLYVSSNAKLRTNMPDPPPLFPLSGNSSSNSSSSSNCSSNFSSSSNCSSNSPNS